jgi:hypothetical protein
MIDQFITSQRNIEKVDIDLRSCDGITEGINIIELKGNSTDLNYLVPSEFSML